MKDAEFLVDEEQRERYLATLRQYEQQTLEQLYGVNQKAKRSVPSTNTLTGVLAAFDKELKFQRKSFQDTGHAVHGSALQEVEQEREVAFEVENVRQVQKPVHFQPFSFPGLHHDLVSFVKTGRMAADSAAYDDAFKLLQRTTVGRKHRVSSDGTAYSKFFHKIVPILIAYYKLQSTLSLIANVSSLHRALRINRVHKDCQVSNRSVV